MSTQAVEVEGVVAELFTAINAFDTDAIMATVTPDALVNDIRASSVARPAIRRWVRPQPRRVVAADHG